MLNIGNYLLISTSFVMNHSLHDQRDMYNKIYLSKLTQVPSVIWTLKIYKNKTFVNYACPHVVTV